MSDQLITKSWVDHQVGNCLHLLGVQELEVDQSYTTTEGNVSYLNEPHINEFGREAILDAMIHDTRLVLVE